MVTVLSLLLAVTLAAPFGEAEAAAVGLDPFTVQVSVEVQRSATAVLARPVGVAGELGAVALVEHDDGRWEGLIELTTIEDVAVVFELLEPGGGSVRSDPVTLSELGVDPVVFATTTSTPASAAGAEGSGDGSALRWLALAVAFGLGALALLGVWALRRSP